jgi:hypothetical protein
MSNNHQVYEASVTSAGTTKQGAVAAADAAFSDAVSAVSTDVGFRPGFPTGYATYAAGLAAAAALAPLRAWRPSQPNSWHLRRLGKLCVLPAPSARAFNASRRPRPGGFFLDFRARPGILRSSRASWTSSAMSTGRGALLPRRMLRSSKRCWRTCSLPPAAIQPSSICGTRSAASSAARRSR